MDSNSANTVRNVKDVREQAKGYFADWIRIADDKSVWTIEDFSYDKGVPEKVDDHCWRCITVNHCWFANENNKKPDEFDYSKYDAGEIAVDDQGIYHPHCHCKRFAMNMPSADDITLMPLGKFDDFFTRKRGIYLAFGYTDDDREEFIKNFSDIVKAAYAKGNYTLFEHVNAGFKINVFVDVPGKGVKEGRIYKFKSGWVIFPDGKLKANTIHAGWRNR